MVCLQSYFETVGTRSCPRVKCGGPDLAILSQLVCDIWVHSSLLGAQFPGLEDGDAHLPQQCEGQIRARRSTCCRVWLDAAPE